VAEAADEGYGHVVLDLLDASDGVDYKGLAVALHRVRREAEDLGLRVSVVVPAEEQHRGLLANGDQTFNARVFRTMADVILAARGDDVETAVA